MIGILDYGVGNLTSLVNYFLDCDGDVRVTKDPIEIMTADLLVLPGVGLFETAINNLNQSGLMPVLNQRREMDLPIVGICLGMQIMLSGSDESPGVKGLGWFEGKCRLFPPTLTVPHMGWNRVRPYLDYEANPLTIPSDVYFVHSYYGQLMDTQQIISVCEHGFEFPAIIKDGNTIGLQFHPEKSGPQGALLLKKMIRLLLPTSVAV